MKEEKAKTKWCPMVRVADCGAENASAVNRLHQQEAPTTQCLASDCMMWVATDNECEPVNSTSASTVSKPAGYCGLARGVG